MNAAEHIAGLAARRTTAPRGSIRAAMFAREGVASLAAEVLGAPDDRLEWPDFGTHLSLPKPDRKESRT